jgi:predicted nucleic acid-binding protein
MSAGEAFFDTNVLLYLLSTDTEKADRAEELLAQGGRISVQVLNEFASVATRKLGFSWAEVGDALGIVRVILQVDPITIETHDRALMIASRYRFSFYDALIVAAALLASCSTLYSEDWQSGLKVEGTLTVVNPFKVPGPASPTVNQ